MERAILQKQSPRCETEYQERELLTALTDQDRIAIGQELSQAQAAVEKAQAEKKVAMKQFASTIEKNATTVSMLSSILRKGKREKLVQVSVTRDYDEGYVEEIRLDTMETLSRRQMSDKERKATH